MEQSVPEYRLLVFGLTNRIINDLVLISAANSSSTPLYVDLYRAYRAIEHLSLTWTSIIWPTFSGHRVAHVPA